MQYNHPTVNQADRIIPINLRQTGPTSVDMLISTRIRKSPYWHLSRAVGEPQCITACTTPGIM